MKGTWQGTDEIDLALELMDVHHVEVRDAVSLEEPQLLQVPSVLLTVDTPFEFTDRAAAHLGAYLTGDGVLLVERVCTPLGRGSKWFLRPSGTIRVCSATAAFGFAPWMKSRIKSYKVVFNTKKVVFNTKKHIPPLNP